MKMLKFFAASLAVFGLTSLASCSSDEPSAAGAGSDVMDADSFLAVRIVNPSDGTRAAEEFDEGTSAERTIKNIAFYFFDNNGDPFLMEDHKEQISGDAEKVYSNKVKPAFDLTQTGGTLATTLVLGKAKDAGWNGAVPTKMVAVANLPGGDESFKKLCNKSLEELLTETKLTQNNLTDKGGYFIMTTSTFAQNDEVIYWNEIGLEHIRTEPEIAKEHPVIIHLERLVAKVTVDIQASDPNKWDGSRFIVAERPIYDENGNQTTKKFYAEIDGWDLNATSRASYLFKHVTANNVPFEYWNDALNFRSYWAESFFEAPYTENNKQYTNSLKKNFRWFNLNRGLETSAYCYENTKEYSIEKRNDAETNATKVLLKATITDENGTPLDLVSWAGMLYTLEDFKEYVAQQMSEDPTDQNKVFPDKIEFKRGSDKDQKRHVVSVYYDGKLVPQFANIRLWSKGATYYIVNIQHTIGKNGKPVYGVVRNHSYRVHINSIMGLGTPGGYDDPENPGTPDDEPETDDPENPDPEVESFVAAKVEVLKWHVVNNNVDVES